MAKSNFYVNDKAAEIFRQNIVDILDHIGITQKAFCERAGMSRQMLFHYLKYRKPIRGTAYYGMMFVLLDLTTDPKTRIASNDRWLVQQRVTGMIDALKNGGFVEGE